MDSKTPLGPICILLEDLGFERREATVFDNDVIEMTYHCHFFKMYYEKIFADINANWILELCFIPEEMHIDRWERHGDLYLVEKDLSVDIHNPGSIAEVSEFINETIIIARDYEAN